MPNDDEIIVDIEPVLLETLTDKGRSEYRERAFVAIEKAYRGQGRHALLSFATDMFLMAMQNHAGRVENITEEKGKRSKGGKARHIDEAIEKAMIHKAWIAWQNGETKYPGDTAFIRAMQSQCNYLKVSKSSFYEWKKAWSVAS
ncbi:hypothetical protein MCERE10_01817 [Burkholderiaceae bacterium]